MPIMVVVVAYFLDNFSATRWSPQKHVFVQKITIVVIIKIISMFLAAWTAVFVYWRGSSLKFSPKDHARILGHGEAPQLGTMTLGGYTPYAALRYADPPYAM